MSDLKTLVKYEMKLQFPFKRKNEKMDIVGSLLSFVMTACIIAVLIYLVSTIAVNYVLVEINKTPDKLARGLEFMNLFYLIVILAMSVLGVEKMRKSICEKKNKEVFLRLPVKSQTIFLSKILVLLMVYYVMTLFLVVPINIIFFIAIKPGAIYWLYTLITVLLFPVVPFLISSILLIPYIKIIDFLKDKYILIFILLSAILMGSFFLYSKILKIVQTLLETGNIRFLFNEELTTNLQNLLKFSYPANSLASISLGVDIAKSIVILIAVVVIAGFLIYLITNSLFKITLYKNEVKKSKYRKVENYKKNNQLISLIKKEFISIFRDSKNMFSYFAISSAMPIMVYCCYSLFSSLIFNTIGINIEFALALLITLIFSVLTNTFCSTNISRDGVAFLKMKSLPVKPSRVLWSKVLFCSIVSSLAVVVSIVILSFMTNLNFVNGLVCAILGCIFSVGQILIATRLDLNHAKLSLSNIEIERESSKTIAKVVFIGLLVSLTVGLLSVILTVFAKTDDAIYATILTYLCPSIICLSYFGLGFIYFKYKLDYRYTNFVM